MASSFEPKDPNFEVRTRDNFGRQAVMKLLGAELTVIEPGRVVIELPYRADLTQQHGFFHAGVTCTIADSAGGYAAYTLLPPSTLILSVEFKMNLLAPARGQLIRAEGTVIRPGSRVTVAEVDVWAEDDDVSTLCAKMLMTTIATPAPTGEGGA